MDSKKYAETMIGKCAEMIVNALSNLSIEDIKLYEVGYINGWSEAIEEIEKEVDSWWELDGSNSEDDANWYTSIKMQLEMMKEKIKQATE